VPSKKVHQLSIIFVPRAAAAARILYSIRAATEIEEGRKEGRRHAIACDIMCVCVCIPWCVSDNSRPG
jgi:hypothetical protein